MQVYSQVIVEFNLACEKIVKEVLKDELGVPVARTRFLYNSHYYPIKIRSYQDERPGRKKLLAYFSSREYSILLNYNLVSELAREDLKNLLRHELAHYFTFINHGDLIDPHGVEFRNFCRSIGWGEVVYSATIEETVLEDNWRKEKERYQKLLALSQSDNEFEAAQALERAQSMALEVSLDSSSEKIYFLKVLETFKRKNSKLQAIYEILEAMNFATIFHYLVGGAQLETYGSWEQVNQTTDVFNYLNASLDLIWKKQTHLKGTAQKNSFFQGFSQGVCSKLRVRQESFSVEQKKALVVYKQELSKAESLIYPKVSKTSSRSNINLYAYNQGFKNGKNFNTQFEKHRYLIQ